MGREVGREGEVRGEYGTSMGIEGERRGEERERERNPRCTYPSTHRPHPTQQQRRLRLHHSRMLWCGPTSCACGGRHSDLEWNSRCNLEDQSSVPLHTSKVGTTYHSIRHRGLPRGTAASQSRVRLTRDATPLGLGRLRRATEGGPIRFHGGTPRRP